MTSPMDSVDYAHQLVGLARQTDKPWLRDAAIRLEEQRCVLHAIEDILAASDVPERASISEGPPMTSAERVAWLVEHWNEAVEERDAALDWAESVTREAQAERDTLRELVQQISVFAARLIPQSLREALNASNSATLSVEHERARFQDDLRRLIERRPL